MSETKYVVGFDPYRKPVKWWHKVFKTYPGIGYSDVFKVILIQDWFKTGDILKTTKDNVPLTILGKPTLTFWSKIKKFFGSENLTWTYKVIK